MINCKQLTTLVCLLVWALESGAETLSRVVVDRNNSIAGVYATPPTISIQPSDTTVTVGDTATFQIDVSSSDDRLFQWYRNGTAIEGATNSTLSLGPLNLGDNGASISVVARNHALAGDASTASRTAMLSVVREPSTLSNLAWTRSRLLSSSAAYYFDAGIDDQGRLTVLFIKSNGKRNALYAVQGEPDDSGANVRWKDAKVVDGLASDEDQYEPGIPQISVSSNGNILATWQVLKKCGASAMCITYLYAARLVKSTGRWEKPWLVGEASTNFWRSQINDSGAVAVLYPKQPRDGPMVIVSRGVGSNKPLSTRLPRVSSRDLKIGLGIDRRGRIFIAAKEETKDSKNRATSHIWAYRGNAGEAPRSRQKIVAGELSAFAVGLHGEVGIVSGDIVVRTSTGSIKATAEKFEDNFRSTGLRIDDKGMFRLFDIGRCTLRRAKLNGPWSAPERPMQCVGDYIWIARNGDFLSYLSEDYWTTFDASRQAMTRSSNISGTPFIVAPDHFVLPQLILFSPGAVGASVYFSSDRGSSGFRARLLK